jgi:hypothetical protein
LGFALEHFDAAGRYREREHSKTVNASGGYRTRSGAEVAFDGARELAEFVAQSEEAHAAFTEQLFHHLVQQPVRAYGAETLENLRESFVSSQFDIRDLAVQAMVVAAPLGRETARRSAKGHEYSELGR